MTTRFYTLSSSTEANETPTLIAVSQNKQILMDMALELADEVSEMYFEGEQAVWDTLPGDVEVLYFQTDSTCRWTIDSAEEV